MNENEFDEITLEAGVCCSSRYVDHYESPPPGEGWQVLRWRGVIKSNGDPRFLVTWRRPRGREYDDDAPAKITCVNAVKFYFDETYDDEVLKTVAAVNASPDQEWSEEHDKSIRGQSSSPGDIIDVDESDPCPF
jgi:hypothetical protein